MVASGTKILREKNFPYHSVEQGFHEAKIKSHCFFFFFFFFARITDSFPGCSPPSVGPGPRFFPSCGSAVFLMWFPSALRRLPLCQPTRGGTSREDFASQDSSPISSTEALPETYFTSLHSLPFLGRKFPVTFWPSDICNSGWVTDL